MKTRIIKKPAEEKFDPITVEIILESKEDLISLMKRTNLTEAEITAALPNYYASVDTSKASIGDLWAILTEKAYELFLAELKHIKKAGD
jgi:hypothetical protein